MIEKLTPERFVFKQGLRWGMLELQQMLNSHKYTSKQICSLVNAILEDLELFMEYGGSNVTQEFSPDNKTCKLRPANYSFRTAKAAQAIEILIETLKQNARFQEDNK